MFKIFCLFLLFISFGVSPVQAADKIKIVTTTNVFASIAQDITQDKAEVYSIASPNRDIHFITPTPKDVMKMQRADLFIHAGLDLEAWRGDTQRDRALARARNQRRNGAQGAGRDGERALDLAPPGPRHLRYRSDVRRVCDPVQQYPRSRRHPHRR